MILSKGCCTETILAENFSHWSNRLRPYSSISRKRCSSFHVASDDVPGHAGSQIDAVGVPQNRVVFDDVVVSAGGDDPDAEVVGLCSEPVSCYPVPTEPVASRGAGQSYASARVGVVPVADRDAVLDVVGGRPGDEDSGQTVGGCRHLRDENARAPAADLNAVSAKPLDDPRPPHHDTARSRDQNPSLSSSLAAAASCRGVALSGNAESAQIERDPGCADNDARRARDRAGDVANQLTVTSNRASRRNDSTDVVGACR